MTFEKWNILFLSNVDHNNNFYLEMDRGFFFAKSDIMNSEFKKNTSHLDARINETYRTWEIINRTWINVLNSTIHDLCRRGFWKRFWCERFKVNRLSYILSSFEFYSHFNPPITDFIYIWYNHSGNNLVTWAHTLNAVPPTQLSFINIAW